MPVCCKCNRSGHCSNCKCSRDGRLCTNCLPSRLKKCKNYQEAAPTSGAVTENASDFPTMDDSNQPANTQLVSCTSSIPSNSSSLTSSTLPLPLPSLDPSDTNTPSSTTLPGIPEDSGPAFNLPPFCKADELDFKWGDLDGTDFRGEIENAYEEVVHWRRNIFMVPSGKVGEQFVAELSSLYESYGRSDARESIAMIAAMTMPALLLQKPHHKSKCKEHIKVLTRRLEEWKKGNISSLLREGRCIQQRLLVKKRKGTPEDDLVKKFTKFMRQGRVRSAIHTLSKQEAGILDLNAKVDGHDERNVFDELTAKHPNAAPVVEDALVTDYPNKEFHPVIFESITGESIYRCALKTNGTAGPSGIDAAGWKRLCSSFKHSGQLCNSMALVARKICTAYVDPEGLTAFTASRLIALDKRPGVRPIAVGEVPRRIISKAILEVVMDEVRELAGCIQLCVGQEGGCEVGVRAMSRIFDVEDTEAALLVDATNAFNLLNRQTALMNIHVTCPSIATALTNVYRGDGNLYIQGQVLKSREGVMQGDPLAMSMYALGILPLIQKLKGTQQVWFADDAAAGGSLENLKEWWSRLLKLGPTYGYHPNPAKTWLVVKEEHVDQAETLFGNSGVNVTSSGQKHLGAALGCTEFVRKFVEKKVSEWCDEITVEPHKYDHPWDRCKWS